MPTEPPAPGTLVTWALLAIPDCVRACCIERAVWSQPPPGAAGARILSSIWAAAEVTKPATAATAIAPRQRLLRVWIICWFPLMAEPFNSGRVLSGTVKGKMRGGKRLVLYRG